MLKVGDRVRVVNASGFAEGTFKEGDERTISHAFLAHGTQFVRLEGQRNDWEFLASRLKLIEPSAPTPYVDPVDLITEPRVFIIGRQYVDWAEHSRLMADIDVPGWAGTSDNASQHLVEVGGRLCYHSFAKPRPGGNPAYLAHVIEEGHGSVLEHAVYAVVITGISRSLSHELVRHRVGLSFSQLSQRYYDESKARFVIPPFLLGDDEAIKEFQGACSKSLAEYRAFVKRAIDKLGRHAMPADRKRIREAARSVLPNATETRIQVTGNARAWRNLIEKRGSQGADAEFRRLACLLCQRFKDIAPDLFADCSVEGECVEVHHKGV